MRGTARFHDDQRHIAVKEPAFELATGKAVLLDDAPGSISHSELKDDADFTRLTALLQWLVYNPNSGLYLRQLPVAGVDTKWVWPRRGIVQDLVRQLLDRTEGAGFHALCGLRAEPARLRMRVLCPRLRAMVGGLCDIEAPVAELAALQLAPTISLVVENLNTGIALPDVDGAVVFMGLGLAVDQLEAIGWLRAAQRHLYWGDLDTHGFVILARARRRFPQTVSVLMEEVTLLTHRDLWVREPAPCRIENPEGLTAAELAVYDGLRVNRWGEQVRLEQERVAWPVALEVISRFSSINLNDRVQFEEPAPEGSAPTEDCDGDVKAKSLAELKRPVSQ